MRPRSRLRKRHVVFRRPVNTGCDPDLHWTSYLPLGSDISPGLLPDCKFCGLETTDLRISLQRAVIQAYLQIYCFSYTRSHFYALICKVYLNSVPIPNTWSHIFSVCFPILHLICNFFFIQFKFVNLFNTQTWFVRLVPSRNQNLQIAFQYINWWYDSQYLNVPVKNRNPDS
jgi:hypothetical protein